MDNENILKATKTNAERVKKHREKQKTLNPEIFKQKQKEKNKKYYNKIKGQEEPLQKPLQEPDEFIILQPIKKRPKRLNKSILKQDTINAYMKSIENIYKNYTNETLLNEQLQKELINILNNRQYSIDIINDKLKFIKTDIYNVIKNNKKDLKNLYSVITRIKTFSKQVKQMYPYIQNAQSIYNEERINRVPDTTTLEKMNNVSFEKENILEILKQENLTNDEKLIVGLLTLFPTRRAIDYRRMIISTTEPRK